MSASDPRDVGLRDDPDLKKDLDATVRARRDLGDDYDSALVDSFLERVEQRIDDVVDRRARRHLAEQQMAAARGTRRPRPADSWAERYGFALITLVLAIPLSAIAGGLAGLSGMVVAWIGIVGVNAVQAVRVNPELFAGRRGDRSAGDR
ncbi:hypothetical protein SAMN05428944_4643 [Streptomyces sp. 1222.5]|uniref:hypothetical protein n=1 Tax=unclassified Streptomyces TaxID=2593676 RepID=UPI000894ADFD|nr:MULTISPECIES: hypothetical protein [unclassified Streptomyces]PKW08257.1 hypothetical protein BX260_3453 [Streptomyces sp. 5112.2]SEC67896.1 hypothetical protein SAMN05428944_4643 [Streptomyces sp. 1222.5]SED15190.1 hypothetical protein SAMN05216532_3605 [Streptomyces sp. 2231.1]